MSKLFAGFDWKNGKFNERQEAYLKLYAETQIEAFLTGQTDEKKAVKHLNAVYANLGKKAPKIIWHDSPEALVMSVRNSVGDSVRGSVRNSVGDSVWGSVWGSVRDSVGGSVRDSVWGSVWDSVRGSVGDSVWGSVGDSVGDSVWDSVWDSVGDSVRSYEVAGWSSFYKFFSEEFEHNALEDWCLYSEQVTGGILDDDVAHLVRKPVRLVRGNNGRLHYDHDKAIEWADGKGFYYLHGVEFKQEDFEKIVSQRVTLTDFAKMGLSNEQRPAALQMLRPDRLLKQVKAKKVDTGKRGVELYAVPNFMGTGRTEYCMKFEHPTIKGKLYLEWCRPEVGEKKDADLAMASNRNLTKEEYLMAELA